MVTLVFSGLPSVSIGVLLCPLVWFLASCRIRPITNDALASLQALADRASKDSCKAAKRALSPTAPPVCATADELLDDWGCSLYHSDSVDGQSCWEQFAVEAGFRVIPSSEDSVVKFLFFSCYCQGCSWP